ncbi:VanZ family protein [Rhizobium sp. G187]|uniref:VanZ family protein n=1 Tax=Rhizobium sp. G187 TaxID=3451352 RepID=UPI003EE57F75
MSKSIFKPVAWLALGLCLAATVVPIRLRPHMAMPADADRILAFIGLGLLFGLAYPRRWLMVAAFLVLAAFMIESTQYLSPSRHPRLDDAAIKAAGAVLGIATAAALHWLARRIRAN